MIPIPHKLVFLCLCAALVQMSCRTETEPDPERVESQDKEIHFELGEANRLAALPMACIDQPLPYKSGHVLADSSDLKMPAVHHPAFYGCFDWHSAVHGHWSLVYLLKQFPELENAQQIRSKLDQNLSPENIQAELEYFKKNNYNESFERTYGWAWLLKLQEELLSWDDPDGRNWAAALSPLAEYLSAAYIEYLPKLVYPIRVGEHSNTAFGLSLAYDYAMQAGDSTLLQSIRENARRFYMGDKACPLSWEPSGYDFLSPCLQELDIMRKVLTAEEFSSWSRVFLPGLAEGQLPIVPAEIRDRTDGKLVHLDGLNFSRAWCLYSINDPALTDIADAHMRFSLGNIVDGDYAGQHWLASFALYAYKCRQK